MLATARKITITLKIAYKVTRGDYSKIPLIIQITDLLYIGKFLF